MKHFSIILSALLLFSPLAVAKTSIPIDIVEILLSRGSVGNVDLVLDQTSPDSPKLSLDDSVKLFGYISFKGPYSYSTNIYTSSKSADDIENLLSNALKAADWTIPEKKAPFYENSGFVSAQRKTVLNQRIFCLDKKQKIFLTTQTIDSGSIAKIAVHALDSDRQDGQCIPIQRPRRFEASGFAELPMPTLELPEADSATSGMRLGSSSSREGRTATFKLKTSASLSSTYQHFIPQLEAQGWAQASNWQNDLVSGGIWESTIDDLRYLVELTVVRVAKDGLFLRLWVQKRK